MAKINFSLEENGYSVREVDKYIDLLQTEYNNALSWGEEMEKKLQKLEENIKDLGMYFTIDEDNQNEVIRRVFEELTATVEKVKQNAEDKAQQIIDAANEKSRNIVRQAMENSVEIRTENTTIMKNLKSINEMISVILEKGIQ
ncbi:MAG: DivIVA domain-containing protein [Oscillospiraceae bacterium]|nr:DivIVA domain-containing protein [Oscillospiraceae bacterium]MDD7292036.1 DivIVA domain-containing protein [Clostridiaceae bacterium]MDY5991551.1 DivIVA domain-containing protein [Oscillospiraceae bacterium]